MLPLEIKACVLTGARQHDDSLASWNLGHQRAAEVYAEYADGDLTIGCPQGSRWR